MCIFLRNRARSLRKCNHREFWLLSLLIVSEFQSLLLMYGKFSRDPLKNPRIWMNIFSILTIKDCSPYEVVLTLKFSSSGAFWVTRYKGTKSSSPPSYLRHEQSWLWKLFSFPKKVMKQSGQKRCTFLKMHALHNGGNHLFRACSRRVVARTFRTT